MGVVIEICVKYPGGRTRIRVTDVRSAVETGHMQDPRPMQALGVMRIRRCDEPYPRARSFLCGVAGFDIPASADDRDALNPGVEPRGGVGFIRLAAGVEM